MQSIKVGLVLIGLSTVSAGVHAAVSWNFGSNNTSATAATITATASAYANTANGTASVSTYGKIETATIGTYGSNGLGIYNKDGVAVSSSCASASTATTGGDCGDTSPSTPEHAMDNNQRYEAMLFTFTNAVQLTYAQIGWDLSGSYDSDISVLRYIGSGSPSATLGGGTKTFADLIASGGGWELVGNYNNAAVTNTMVDSVSKQGTVALNTTTSQTSSYWLVAAYLGGTTAGWGGKTGGDATADYVKVLALYGDKPAPPGGGGTPGVPEPGSIALLSVSLLGVGFMRRKRIG